MAIFLGIDGSLLLSLNRLLLREKGCLCSEKSLLTTRVGDVALVIGLVMLWDLFGSLDFAVVFDADAIRQVDSELSN